MTLLLREQDIEKIVDTYQHRRDLSRYARRVSMNEIEKNDFNLNIFRYVSTSTDEEKIYLQKVNADLKGINERIEQATDKYNRFLKELGLPLI